eukprot:CAMPEP_0202100826 /NCGR_PEP_ID=MMETSP0965-20130614/3370_1 /ASSEMBLY_ACC=CAM_ASM_000507 /TAXON_ID=4773 /ORGANISM="Schizochytrium aggregatum, Strain ATCC28209" /LENGTH=269 /DNA_ID=CAMNT_0048669503 /DNA_START=950 /DNA_END=1757 /DNA_ORIENTATION=+
MYMRTAGWSGAYSQVFTVTISSLQAEEAWPRAAGLPFGEGHPQERSRGGAGVRGEIKRLVENLSRQHAARLQGKDFPVVGAGAAEYVARSRFLRLGWVREHLAVLLDGAASRAGHAGHIDACVEQGAGAGEKRAGEKRPGVVDDLHRDVDELARMQARANHLLEDAGEDALGVRVARLARIASAGDVQVLFLHRRGVEHGDLDTRAVRALLADGGLIDRAEDRGHHGAAVGRELEAARAVRPRKHAARRAQRAHLAARAPVLAPRHRGP